MKKWMLLAASSLLMINAHATESWCSYEDVFRISDHTPPWISIDSSFNDPELILSMTGPRSFTIKDAGQCRSGFAHVTVTDDVAHYCILDIKDGPLMNHPTVKATCKGIYYKGIRYDGFDSYTYNIDISPIP